MLCVGLPLFLGSCEFWSELHLFLVLLPRWGLSGEVVSRLGVSSVLLLWLVCLQQESVGCGPDAGHWPLSRCVCEGGLGGASA